MILKGLTIATPRRKQYVVWLTVLDNGEVHVKMMMGIHMFHHEDWFPNQMCTSEEEAIALCVNAVKDNVGEIKHIVEEQEVDVRVLESLQQTAPEATGARPDLTPRRPARKGILGDLFIEFAEIFEDSVADGEINTGEFFSCRDGYYKFMRNAIRRDAITKEYVIRSCEREPQIEDPDAKAYAAGLAKYYLHVFDIVNDDIPAWIDETEPCEYWTPFTISLACLKSCAKTTPKEFLEKEVLTRAYDLSVV